MDICCTRLHCEQPLNSFVDLDDSKLLDTVTQQHCTQCGMPLILEGRYVPIQLLQRHARSTTFLGRDLHAATLKYCTISQLQLDPSFNPSQVEVATQIFDREVKILAKLGEHPNIPRLFDSLEVTAPVAPDCPPQKFLYLIQEYISGQTLEAELLANGKFTEAEVLVVLREIARILEFIHVKGSIHQNIRPSTIRRDSLGKIYLVDFGAIAQINTETVAATGDLSSLKSKSGFRLEYALSNHYSRPEIYPSSDLYSLAVTCLNLLTGKPPKNFLNTETNTWQWRTPDLQVSDSLAEILDRMLQQLPAARFASARDVLDALDASLGTPILSLPLVITTAEPISSSTLLLDATYDDPFQRDVLDPSLEPPILSLPTVIATAMPIDSSTLIFDDEPFQLDDSFWQLDDEFLQLDLDLFQLDDRLFEPVKPLKSLDNAPLQIIPKATPKAQKSWLKIVGVIAGIAGLSAIVIPSFLRLFKSNPSPSGSLTQAMQTSFSNRTSIGERILVGIEGNRNTYKFRELKKAGITAIASKNYPEAITKLQAALVENPNAPETLIYLNNALVGDKKSYTIVAAAPIERSLNRAAEMLRGFAQAQAEINQVGDVNEAKLKIRIVDDSDNPKTIENVATGIANLPEVLGVVGHSRNDVTMKAANIYNRQKVAFIAPISTAMSLTGSKKPYIFRTSAKGDVIAQQLVDHLVDVARKKRVAIFYVPTIPYNDEFKNQFTAKLKAKGGQVVSIFPFSAVPNSTAPTPVFDAETYLRKAKAMGAEAILLLPVGRSSREAIKVLKIRASKYRELDVISDTALYNLNTLKAGSQTRGLVMSVPWQESESMPQFSTGAKQLWNTQVNWATATSYNAVKAMGAAIKAQEQPSKAGVIDFLSKNEFMGATGRFQFKGGESTGRNVLVMVAPTPLNYKYSSSVGYDFIPVE